MFSKDEAKEKRKRFWTNFGIYMKKYIPEYGSKIKWVNYPTRCKSVKFKMNADNKLAVFSIVISHNKSDVIELFYLQFLEYKSLMNQYFKQELIWLEKAFDSKGNEVSLIYLELPNKSIFLEENWEELYYFFEQNIVAAHEFWLMVGDVFCDLEEQL